MRIALINGSPKVKNSASGKLLSELQGCCSEKAEIVEFGFHSANIPENAIKELENADVWVFAYPLYVDGIPGHLLSCLVQLEEACRQNLQIRIYGIVNCGFYEGIQAEFALKVLQNWSVKAGLLWGGGIGIGGGGALAMIHKTERGHGPKAPIEKALAAFSDSILKKEVRDDYYVSIGFPRFLYRMGAQIGWRQMIKENGGKTKDLGKISE